MVKKNKRESLIELHVQDIPNQANYFSRKDLEWKTGDDNGEMDLCPAIPPEILPHFFKGEDGVIPLVDDDVNVRGNLSHENITTDGWKSSNASNDNFHNSIDYINSLLHNLPSSADEKLVFIQCVERFRKDLHASLASSSKFTSILGSENMSMRQISPWFSPSKKHKCHSIHERGNINHQVLNERVKEHEGFQFPHTNGGQKKKKKIANHSSIEIQKERAIIMKQHTSDDEENTQHRLPFSIDLNQTTINELQIIDDTICETQPSMLSVIPT
ncbi:uncharacterized protein LOC131031400 isoform X1 [Cryptomeria japonica]|uniref:uncharacterized protein LOC131031400 isoform X1 n=1 Tax=Cryptomeria japonica TaxID=3369 RepID=UPI0027DA6C90|nr:uncharacterized protein LOC131031400 isoform X1 [Cryptomeria japonica]